ncbi:hypothetical protein BDV93DRAFT_515842 [Ceratobasidium sp. AG-I]|nr:hypothetical protein BDV93DRAFT_515842 [Ceratobasidium sp. AG-I]
MQTNSRKLRRCNGCGKERQERSLLTCVACQIKSYCHLKSHSCVIVDNADSGPFKCLQCCQRDDTKFTHTLLSDRSVLPSVSTVFLCVWYLPAKTTEAQGFRLAIEGALICYGLEVIVYFAPLHEVINDKKPGKFLRHHDIPKGSFFLACILTEGTMSGGGGSSWCETSKERYHETLALMYRDLFPDSIAEAMISKFKRRTVLQLACGVSLHEKDVKELQAWIERTDLVDEVIAPTTLAFHPAQFLGFVVSLTILLYFKGKDFDTSLTEAWLRDEQSREHSDLLVVRPARHLESLVWSPDDRPFGLRLPRCGSRKRDGLSVTTSALLVEPSSRSLFEAKATLFGSNRKAQLTSAVHGLYLRSPPP